MDWAQARFHSFELYETIKKKGIRRDLFSPLLDLDFSYIFCILQWLFMCLAFNVCQIHHQTCVSCDNHLGVRKSCIGNDTKSQPKIRSSIILTNSERFFIAAHPKTSPRSRSNCWLDLLLYSVHGINLIATDFFSLSLCVCLTFFRFLSDFICTLGFAVVELCLWLDRFVYFDSIRSDQSLFFILPTV